MLRGVGFYKTKRRDYEVQTLLNHKVQIATDPEQPQVSTQLKIARSVKFTKPTDMSFDLQPGRIYVRRTSHGMEFVRKPASRREEMDCDRKTESYRQSTSMGVEEARLLHKKKQLQAALAAIEEAEIEASIGTCESCSCHLPTISGKNSRSSERETSITEVSPKTRLRCRPRSSIRVSEPEVRYTECSGRSTRHCIRHGDSYASEKRSGREYHIGEASSIEQQQSYGRRASYQRQRLHQCREEIPRFYHRVILQEDNRRRRSSSEGCHNRKPRQYHGDGGYDFETREPEDYLCQYYSAEE